MRNCVFLSNWLEIKISRSGFLFGMLLNHLCRWTWAMIYQKGRRLSSQKEVSTVSVGVIVKSGRRIKSLWLQWLVRWLIFLRFSNTYFFIIARRFPRGTSYSGIELHGREVCRQLNCDEMELWSHCRSSLASGLDKTVYGSYVTVLPEEDELSLRILVSTRWTFNLELHIMLNSMVPSFLACNLPFPVSQLNSIVPFPFSRFPATASPSCSIVIVVHREPKYIILEFETKDQ